MPAPSWPARGPPRSLCAGADPHLCPSSQHGAASGATGAETCRSHHAPAAQGEPGPGWLRWPGPCIPVPSSRNLSPGVGTLAGAEPAVPCFVTGGDALGAPRHPLAAGRAGRGHSANATLQQDAGRGPHATGHGHRRPGRGGRRGGTARRCLEPAVRCVLGQDAQPGHGGPERGARVGWEPLTGTPSRCGAAAACWGRAGGAECVGLGAGDGGGALGMRRCLAGCLSTPTTPWAPGQCHGGWSGGSAGRGGGRAVSAGSRSVADVGWRSDSAVPSACRGQRDDGWPGHRGAGRGPAAACRALAAGHRQSQEGGAETLTGGPWAQLPHPQPDGEGARPGPGLQLGRDRALQVLQRVLPPGTQQLRPDAGQPAAAAADRAGATGARAQPPLLPAHPLRGRLLHGRAEHVANGGEALGGRVQLHRLRRGLPAQPWLDAFWQTLAQRKGPAEGGVPPGFTWPEGTEARWDRDGGVGGRTPSLLSAKQLVPPATRGPARGTPAQPCEGSQRGYGAPRCSRGSAGRSPAPCQDCCPPTPAFGGLGLSVAPRFGGGRKGTTPRCPPGTPGLAVAGAALRGGGVPGDRGAGAGWGSGVRAPARTPGGEWGWEWSPRGAAAQTIYYSKLFIYCSRVAAPIYDFGPLGAGGNLTPALPRRPGGSGPPPAPRAPRPPPFFSIVCKKN